MEADHHSSETIFEDKHSCIFDFPHLQSGGVAAEVGGVDEAEAEDSNAATVEGSNVAQSTVLQVCYLDWLACWVTDIHEHITS